MAGQMLVAAVQDQHLAAEAIRMDAAAQVHGHPAERVDQLREVLEVDLDDVVDLQPVAHELLDGLSGEPRAAERVGSVDLLSAVARNVRLRVAQDRHPPYRAW